MYVQCVWGGGERLNWHNELWVYIFKDDWICSVHTLTMLIASMVYWLRYLVRIRGLRFGDNSYHFLSTLSEL